jgi:hypothetical protein
MRRRAAGALIFTSFRLLSCVEVIVPARFCKAEGFTGDDTEKARPVIRDKLSQREVAGNVPCGPLWAGKQR